MKPTFIYFFDFRKAILLLLLLTGSGFVKGQSLASSGYQPGRRAEQLPQTLSLREVLQEIKVQYNVNFVCKGGLLDNKAASIKSTREKRLDVVLKSVLEPLGLNFRKMDDKVYLIFPKEEPTPAETEKTQPGSEETGLLNTLPESEKYVTLNGKQVNVDVSGKITDENQQTLVGVSVVVKGTTIGTTSAVDGTYKLNVPEGSTLVFSFIGYTPEEVVVGNRTVIDVKMVLDIKSLGEVVVIGYGEAKKQNYTGAVSTVNTKEIVQAPVADISNALSGRLSGLIAVQRNGEPGRDGSQLLIRGQSTTGDNSPLVVVDGIPRGNFSQIDPNEIESITLLKDPASAAVFGVRAANGVILVTTKRGKAGKSTFSLSARSDWQTPTRLPKYLDSYGYATLFNAAREADGNAPKFSQAELDAYRNGTDRDAYPNTDWVKETIGGYAPQQQYNLSLNGGTEKIRYFVSLGNVNQKGLYANSAFKRYNFRSNIDADATSTTRISLDISGRIENRDSPSEAANQLLYYALFAPPIYPAYFSNGLPGAFPTGRNPAERARSGGYNKEVANTLLTTLTIQQQLPFIKGLSVKGIVAFDKDFGTRKSWRTPYKVYGYDPATKAYNPINGDGINTISLYQRFYQNNSLTMEAHLNYARTFGRHDVGALVLYTQNQSSGDNFDGSRDNFISSNLDQFLAGNPATQRINGGAYENGRRGVVGRLTYAYNGRYLLEANFRYDGVSTFAPGRQFGFFPSVSAGWKISEENFFRDHLTFVDYFKIRGSYGELGNDRIPGYRFLSTYRFGSGYVFGEGSDRRVYEGLAPSAAADPNTTWEVARSLNLGFDGSIFKRLLSFEFDWFHKRTEGILAQNSNNYVATIGQDAPTQNVGIVSNRGIELALTHENTLKLGTDLGYFVRANFTYARNEIITIGERPDKDANILQAGRSIGQFFGYQAIGLFQSQEEIDNAPTQPNAVKPGDIRYADLNGRGPDGKLTGQPDGKIDGADIAPIGLSSVPQIIYGLSAGVNFKGFDLSFLFQGAGRVNTFVTGELAWPFYNGAKALVDHQDYWREDNRDAKYPRLTEQPQGNNLERSSYWLKDASYLRLKNLELGYSLPKQLLSKISVGSARIFVSGQNLLTFDKLKVVDPEGPGDSGSSFNQNPSRGWFYPQQRVYSVGLNVTF